MNKYIVACLLLVLGLGVGFWAGRQQTPQIPDASAVSEKKPLYYRNQMNPKATSPVPMKDEMGMDYTPVYADEPTATSLKSGKILYYRHPMGAADTSLIPKKDEMGMDYVPVYENGAINSGHVQISPEKIQKLGVKTEILAKRILTRTIRALGSIQVDEQSVHEVTSRFEGWIQRLYVNTTGQSVKRGQALLEAYSPELVTAQQEYLLALLGQQALQQASLQAQGTEKHLVDNALQRLLYWNIAPANLQRLQRQKKVLDTLPLLSPVNGVVMEKPAVEGMRFMPGELLFRIADLSTVWLLIDVFEKDSGDLRLGQNVQVNINAYSDRVFNGRIGFIYPTLSIETRTVKVRVVLSNTEGLLRPGLYGSVSLTMQEGNNSRLAVPDSAVIDSGIRQLVLVEKGDGQFEPRTVKLGRQTDGYYEVLKGLETGEKVVIRANFLIDAESNLKSALDSFNTHDTDKMQPMPEMQHGDH